MSDDGDYHKTMDSALFEKWLLKILPAIVKAANGRQPVLVLDNAPYHSKLIEKVCIESHISCAVLMIRFFIVFLYRFPLHHLPSRRSSTF